MVKLKDDKTAIGVVTFIKRDYLDHHDIGFAFLPDFCGSGYAYEATLAVLNKMVQQHNHSHILATTIPENSNSIKLLEKLGLQFEKEIKVEKETLHVYAVSIEKLNTPYPYTKG